MILSVISFCSFTWFKLIEVIVERVGNDENNDNEMKWRSLLFVNAIVVETSHQISKNLRHHGSRQRFAVDFAIVIDNTVDQESFQTRVSCALLSERIVS